MSGMYLRIAGDTRRKGLHGHAHGHSWNVVAHFCDRVPADHAEGFDSRDGLEPPDVVLGHMILAVGGERRVAGRVVLGRDERIGLGWGSLRGRSDAEKIARHVVEGLGGVSLPIPQPNQWLSS
jgi:hypothetical protein